MDLRVAFACVAIISSAGCKNERSGTNAARSDQAIPTYVAEAITDKGRDLQKIDDAKRKPAQIISFSGAKPGDKLLELIPGEGYWTRIFSKAVGPKGHVYAVWPQNYARYSQAKVRLVTAMSRQPAYANVSVEVQPTPVLSAPEPLDLVFTSQNYHDYPAEFMGDNDPAILNDAVFRMLKPGGIYIVIDHAAAPGTTLAQTRELHRIDPASVKRQVAKAGFEFVGEINVLRNPNDQYDLKVFDPKVRGHTDKFAFKFRKPAR